MKNGFALSIQLPAGPEEIYNAWLSSEGHSSLTGSPSRMDGKVGGKFSAWDGYIFGEILELEPPRRILQSWRTTEFPEDALDSQVELILEPVKDGTKLVLRHWDMPPDQVESYRQGWEDFYFKPMRAHFGE